MKILGRSWVRSANLFAKKKTCYILPVCNLEGVHTDDLVYLGQGGGERRCVFWDTCGAVVFFLGGCGAVVFKTDFTLTCCTAQYKE